MSNELNAIGTKYGTDKVEHGYTEYYNMAFEKIRSQSLKILEIGVYRGSSIRMWAEYFPNSTVYGIDNGRICSKEVMNSLKSNRIIPYYADQSKREDLEMFIKDCGGDFDIIIDDGHHYQEHQQLSWGILFPYLKKKGFYIIEDLAIPSKRLEEQPYRKPNISENELDWSARWGIQDGEKFTDATWNVLLDFINSMKLNSPYMTEKETKYIEENILRNKHGLPLITIHARANSTVAFMNKKGDA